MKEISKVSFIKLIKPVILLTPMSFLFHYIETSLFTNASIFAFFLTSSFIVLAGIISVEIKHNFIFLINIVSVLLSMLLGRVFITAPNESWFNPFGMNFAIVFIGIIILLGILIIRLFAKSYWLWYNRKVRLSIGTHKTPKGDQIYSIINYNMEY